MSGSYLPISPASTSTPTFNPSTPSFPNQANGASGSSSAIHPLTRSRTLFYLSIRDSSITPRRGPKRSAGSYGNTLDVGDEDEGLLPGGRGKGGSVGIDMNGLPPKWVDISDEIEDILGRIPQKIAALEKLHTKHALPGFVDRTAEEREIERQTNDITRDFRRCTNLISSIRPSPNAVRVEVTTAKNVQRGLAQKVQDLSAQFRKKQKVYMQKLQGHAIKNKDLMVASGAITLKGTDLLDELEDDEQASKDPLKSPKTSQSQTQSQATVAVDVNIDQRTNEITQIASSITELADLFRSLGNLVVEQGTVLDSVEYNVQQTSMELKSAEEELKVAQKYQANTGRRKCILLLVLIIVGLIIVLIYKPRGGPSPPPPSPPPGPDPTEPAATPISDTEGISRPIPGNVDSAISDSNAESAPGEGGVETAADTGDVLSFPGLPELGIGGNPFGSLDE